MTFKEPDNFLKTQSQKIINEIEEEFSQFLDAYIVELQSLFDELHRYAEDKKNNNEELDELVGKYEEILINMNEIAENSVNMDNKNIDFCMQNIYDKTREVDSEFFENYYFKNFSSYLEYPDEILHKVNDSKSMLKSSAEIVKSQINYMVLMKIQTIKEENHYYISKSKEFLINLSKKIWKINQFMIIIRNIG